MVAGAAKTIVEIVGLMKCRLALDSIAWRYVTGA
jgi:hypothetical protein